MSLERATSYKNATSYWCSDLQCKYIIHDRYWNSQVMFFFCHSATLYTKTESLFVIELWHQFMIIIRIFYNFFTMLKITIYSIEWFSYFPLWTKRSSVKIIDAETVFFQATTILIISIIIISKVAHSYSRRKKINWKLVILQECFIRKSIKVLQTVLSEVL